MQQLEQAHERPPVEECQGPEQPSPCGSGEGTAGMRGCKVGAEEEAPTGVLAQAPAEAPAEAPAQAAAETPGGTMQLTFEAYEGCFSAGSDLATELMTVRQAKVRCMELPGCRGFCFQGPPRPEWIVEVFFKSAIELGGECNAAGWTSYRVKECAQAVDDSDTPASVEEERLAECLARDSEAFTVHEGCIPEEGTIYVRTVTLREARLICAYLPYCRGFTFKGSPTGDPVEVFFKNRWELLAGTGWTSYRAERGVFDATLPRTLPEPGTRVPPGGPDSRRRWVLVSPVKGLCNRLRALVAGMMLAEDLGREIALDWRNSVACNCPWSRLVEPTPGLHVVRKEQLREDDEALQRGVELVNLWANCINTAHDPEMLRESMEAFDSRHREVVRSGRACFVDVFSPQWRQMPRVKDVPYDQLPECLKVDCIAVRAYNWFYPATEKDRELASEDRSFHLNRLVPAPAVAGRVWRLPKGTISVHVRRTDHKTACLHSPDELFEEEMDLRCSGDWQSQSGIAFGGKFFVATDEPEVEASLRGRYGERIISFTKRTLKRRDPEGIEDAFVDLLLLAQGAEIIGSFRSSFSAVASLFHRAPLHVVNSESVGNQDFGGYREVPLSAADPWKDMGRFFLVGSWDNWKGFTELRRKQPGSVACNARVRLKQVSKVESFQVILDKDWTQRFYPSKDGQEILGPSNAHGSNWQVKIPAKCGWLSVTFMPTGAWRTLEWKCLSHIGLELLSESQGNLGAPRRKPVAPSFFLAGSWNQWGFTELQPRSDNDPICQARVRVRKAPGVEEFQIIEDQDWQRRYFPSGNDIEGPCEKHGANWQVQVPELCAQLEVIWDPRGARSIQWRFIGSSGFYLRVQARQEDFSLLGSWDQWSDPVQLMPAKNGTPAYTCCLMVHQPPVVMEFVVIGNHDEETSCYFPANDGASIVGPARNECRSAWSVAVPQGCTLLEVSWSPRSPSLRWRFLGPLGKELHSAALKGKDQAA